MKQKTKDGRALSCVILFIVLFISMLFYIDYKSKQRYERNMLSYISIRYDCPRNKIKIIDKHKCPLVYKLDVCGKVMLIEERCSGGWNSICRWEKIE